MEAVGPVKGAGVTEREAEILALIARHLTNAQIADALFISTRTVETHVSAMLRKLDLADRRSLARQAEAVPGLLVKSGSRVLPVPVTSFIGRAGERAALAAALAEHRDALARLAVTFARLGCPYQQARTARMAAGPLAQEPG